MFKSQFISDSPSAQTGLTLLSEPSLVALKDFLAFRSLVTPKVIQIVFWLGTAYFVVSGLTMTIMGLTGSGLMLMLIGLLMLSLGPIAVRVCCELVMLIFQIGEAITEAVYGSAKRDPVSAV